MSTNLATATNYPPTTRQAPNNHPSTTHQPNSPFGTNLAIASRHLAAERRPLSSSRYKNEATKPNINQRNEADLVESCLRRSLDAISECSGEGGLLISDSRRRMWGGMLIGEGMMEGGRKVEAPRVCLAAEGKKDALVRR
jgi:hypothetical protein